VENEQKSTLKSLLADMLHIFFQNFAVPNNLLPLIQAIKCAPNKPSLPLLLTDNRAIIKIIILLANIHTYNTDKNIFPFQTK
jgi:hypothetical protein